MYGPFAFTGGKLGVAATRKTAECVQFANAGADTFAGLAGVACRFDDRPYVDAYVLCDALGLTAAQAAALPVELEMEGVDAETAERYRQHLSLTVADGKLVLRNTFLPQTIIVVR